MTKYSRKDSAPLLGIGITKDGIDGLPCSFEKDGDFLSLASKLKLDKSGVQQKDTYPLEFDDMTDKGVSSFIGVVHIDGNDMGQAVASALAGAGTFSEKVKHMRELSKKVDKVYKDAFSKTIEDLKKKNGKIPVRPLIMSGDDVTFVCEGKIAIKLAEKFLINMTDSLNVNGQEIKLSACAGIAIVNSHFPFYQAYELAENLCSSAKKKAKALVAGGCWMDYHIVFSGLTGDIPSLRKDTYVVPGMTAPALINNNYKTYNLLLRPWCVKGNADSKYQWSKFIEMFNELKKWPRSRLKTLRNRFLEGESSVTSYVRECESRGYELPKFNSMKDEFSGYQTPYFEALEILEFCNSGEGQ